MKLHLSWARWPCLHWPQLREGAGPSRPGWLLLPGLRLMRNLSMGAKIALLMTSLLVPSALLAIADWREHQRQHEMLTRAQLAAEQFGALTALNSAVINLTKQVFRREVLMDRFGELGNYDAELNADQAAYGEFETAMQRGQGLFDGGGLRSALEHLRTTRKHSMEVIRLDNTPRVNGQSERMTRLRAYFAALEQFRQQAAVDWAVISQIDDNCRALYDGGLEPMFQVSPSLSRLIGSGSRILDGQNDAQRRNELSTALIETRQLLLAAEPPLARVRQVGLLPQETVDKALDGVHGVMSVAQRLLVLASREPPSQEEVARLEGGRKSFGDRGVLVYQAVLELQRQSVMAIKQDLQHTARLREQTRWWLLLVGAVSLMLAAYLLLSLYLVMRGGLARLNALIQRLGRGDLSPGVPALGADEIGSALNGLNHAIDELRELFIAVTQGVAAVSHASREVAAGNGGLSQQTGAMRNAVGRVAGSAQGSAAAMDECAAAVDRATEHVHSARANARRSSKSMRSLQQRMQSLQERSREINQMVLLMETVAFQTKLLSLNASVESARAGEVGRSFGVVAAEVRALAARSEQAAAKIRDIVGASVRDIEDGSQIVSSAGEAVHLTDEEIQAVSALIGEVAGLTGQGMTQSREVLDIARNVESYVAANVHLIDQLAGAAGSLRDQGDSLKRSVRHFVLG